MPGYKFDLQQFFDAKGLKLEDVGDKGLIVRDEQGRKLNFDPKAFLSANKVNPAQADIFYNSPDSALDKSPVSLVDRAKLSLGNVKGQADYLGKKFEGVAQTDEGLVVKNKGVWQKVDPSFFSGGVRELAADVAEAIGGNLPTIGAIAGAPAGGIAGAAAGGAGGETLRTSLGRIVGTYQATPEEQLQDVGFEGMLGLGGEVIGLGAKVGIKQIGKALGNIAEWAAPQSKKLVAEALGRTTGVGPKAMEVGMDYSDDVAKKIQKYSKEVTDLSQLDEVVTLDKQRQALNFINAADDKLNAQYGVNLNAIADKVGKDFSVDFSKIFTQAKEAVESTGAGKFVETKGGQKFVPLTPDDLATVAGQEGKRISLDPAEFAAARDIATQIARLEKIGTLKGKKAVFALQQINSGLNKVSQGAYSSSNQMLGAIASRAKSGFENGLIQALPKEAAADWGAMQTKYATIRNSLNQFRKVQKSPNGARLFADRLLADSAVGRGVQGETKVLVDFMGEEGQKLYQDVVTTEAARRFSSFLPRMGLWPQLATTSTAGAAIATGGPDEANVGTAAAGALALGALSPRTVFSTIRYSRKLMGFLKGLNNDQRKLFLQNPQIVNATFSGVGQAVAGEARDTEMLLQGMGVVPNGK